MVAELHPIRVVAFDDSGKAVVLPSDKWAIRLDKYKCVLRTANGSAKREFRLKEDLLALLLDTKEKTAWGKTLGRVALTGMATSILLNGRGLGGALLDVSLRGTAKKLEYQGALIFRDTSTFEFTATEAQMVELKGLVSNDATSSAASSRAETMFQLLERVMLDGEKAVGELTEKSKTLKQQLADKLKLTDTSETFEARDASRRECELLSQETRNLDDLVAAATWELMQKKAALGRKTDQNNSISTIDRGGIQRMSIVRYLTWIVLGAGVSLLIFFPVVVILLENLGISSGVSGVIGLAAGLASAFLWVRGLIRRRKGNV